MNDPGPEQVSVIGSRDCEQSSEAAQLAAEVGARLAQAGVTVVCGGLAGVMEAVSRGAAQAGGRVIGVVPGNSTQEANPYCTDVIASGVGFGRNIAVVASGAVVIAVGGGWGTLSEIGHARSIGRTVVALHSWTVSGRGEMAGGPGVITVSSPEEAVALALGVLAEQQQ